MTEPRPKPNGVANGYRRIADLAHVPALLGIAAILYNVGGSLSDIKNAADRNCSVSASIVREIQATILQGTVQNPPSGVSRSEVRAQVKAALANFPSVNCR